MMTSIYDTLSTLDSAIEDWRGLEYNFLANEVSDSSKKRENLLNGVGPRTYQLVQNHIAPVKPGVRVHTVPRAPSPPRQFALVQNAPPPRHSALVLIVPVNVKCLPIDG